MSRAKTRNRLKLAWRSWVQGQVIPRTILCCTCFWTNEIILRIPNHLRQCHGQSYKPCFFVLFWFFFFLVARKRGTRAHEKNVLHLFITTAVFIVGTLFSENCSPQARQPGPSSTDGQERFPTEDVEHGKKGGRGGESNLWTRRDSEILSASCQWFLSGFVIALLEWFPLDISKLVTLAGNRHYTIVCLQRNAKHVNTN